MIESRVPLAPLCTLKAGGSARFFCRAEDEDGLLRACRHAADRRLPVFFLGGGSNVLFRDGEYGGLVVKSDMANVEVDGTMLHAGGGALLSTLVLAAQRARLSGVEAFAGLPGTVGGAVRGNAGCYGTEIKDVLVSAKLYNPLTDSVHEEDASYFQFGYRESRLKECPEVVLSVRLRLVPEGDISVAERTRDIAQQRAVKQPRLPTAGSFFKNPGVVTRAVQERLPEYLRHVPSVHSWQVVDALGLRGASRGGAQVSEVHANYIVNTGGATAEDILTLAGEIEKQAAERFGIGLVREVMVV